MLGLPEFIYDCVLDLVGETFAAVYLEICSFGNSTVHVENVVLLCSQFLSQSVHTVVPVYVSSFYLAAALRAGYFRALAHF